ncbi:tektin-1 [Procambarus clarkii]|uniref:tektin-1 n=1 Tax=Procambarus clarkii TaxID=6728 RepID=UPI001E6712B7|nr:tektin-1-like [Procambarus clarkii]
MALLARDRRVSRSEYTRDYYRTSSSITTPTPASQEHPHAPAVPPRRPGQGGSDAWVPPPPINPAVWRASHSAKLHDSYADASHAQRTRAENRRLCEEAERLTAKHRQEVERRLTDRVFDVSFWREELGARHAAMEQDAAALTTLRERLSKAHQLYLQPLEVAHQCIQIRSGRVGVEEVEDEASAALRQEVQELLRCRDVLARTLADADHQFRRVLASRYHLEKNLQDKDAALRVDEATTNLTPTAPPTAIIPRQAVDPSPISVEWWRETGVKLLHRADDEHQLSAQILALAEDILVATSRHLRERLEHTDHCLQARILDTRHAKTLLEEQHAKLVEEERQLEQSLVEVEDQLEAKRGPLALAQTRLHTRTRRPNMERTRDEVEAALLREVQELELTISRLTSAAEMSRDHLQRLRSTKVSLEHDINLKAKTLLLDEVKVVALRNTVKIDTY